MGSLKLGMVPFLFLVAFLSLYCPLAKGEHPKFEACKKSSEKYFKRIHKVAMDCHSNVKDDKLSLEQQFDKFGCTVKCLLKTDKMIDDNELVTEDLLKGSYKGRVIPEFEDKLLSHFIECKAKFGDKLDKADPMCKSYKEYGLCMQEAISHVCYEQP